MSRYPDHMALHAAYEDLVGDEETGIIAFCQHIGLKMPNVASAWWPTFVMHYRPGRKVDMGRFCRDLVTFPPVAARIDEIRAEKKQAEHA